jgi:hypothetical protein
MALIDKKLIDNRCQNSSIVNQLNEIIQPTYCYGDIQARCTDNKGVINRECIDLNYEILDEISKKSIDQININNILSTCEINTAIEVLTSKVKSEEDLITLILLQEAKEKARNKQPGVFSCNEIDNNISKDRYTISLLECLNSSSVNQLNRAKGCNPAVAYQINENNEIKKCLINLGVLTETEEKQEPVTLQPQIFNSTTTPTQITFATTTPVSINNNDNNTDILKYAIIIGVILLMITTIILLVIFL